MVLGMRQGERYVKVHGRVIRTGDFQQGIIAGCSWAKDILKTIISKIKHDCEAAGLPMCLAQHGPSLALIGPG